MLNCRCTVGTKQKKGKSESYTVAAVLLGGKEERARETDRERERIKKTKGKRPFSEV